MAESAFRDYCEAVREAADIVEIIGETVKLKRAGRSLVGLCPFHQEKTPSFSVDPQKGVYYCFGCQRGGDLFRFVQELHQLDFPDAVRWLGDRYNIPRPASRGGGGKAALRDRVLSAIDEAHRFFTSNLGRPEAAAARELLARRGLLGEAERFGIGYALPGWEELLRRLTARGYDAELLLEAGLVVPRQSGRGVYDRFRDRVTFPIRSSSGRIVSFGGRIVGDGEPKYLNGPETAVYDKGRTLFRLSEAASEIRSAERAVLVEGYFDALSLAAAGVPGVVALCGTALAEGHVRLLGRWAKRVVLVFDADDAGRRAANRALGPLLQAGLAVRVAFPPDGLDPDDLVRERGAEAAHALIEGALDLAGFLVEHARRSHDLSDPDDRVAAFEEILAQLANMPSAVARVEAASAVADRLDLDEQAAREELRRAARGRRRTVKPVAVGRAAARGEKLPELESVLLRYLVGEAREEPARAAALVDEIPLDRLGTVTRQLVERWRDACSAGVIPDLPELLEPLPEAERAEICRLAFAPGPAPDHAQAKGALSRLKEEELRGRLALLQRQIEREEDPDKLASLLREKLDLAREITGVAAAPRERPSAGRMAGS